MNFLMLNKYQIYDFAESYLGYSLKGSGRFIKFEKKENMNVLNVKRFFSNRCDCNEFVFTQNSCVLSRNYWHNEDITQHLTKFLNEQVEFNI